MRLHSLIKKGSCILTAAAVLFTAFGCTQGAFKSVSSNPKDLDTLTFTSEGWDYDTEADVYSHSFDYAIEKSGAQMTVFVPGGYFESEEKDGLYTVSVAEEGRKNVYETGKAPVVIMTGKTDISAYMNEGTVFAELSSDASAIDIEMAVRTLKYNAKDNSKIFPASYDAYYLIGGNTIALAGVTADDDSSIDLLKEFGVPMQYEDGEDISDNVLGVIIDRPATGGTLERAASAWMYAYKNKEKRVDILDAANSYAKYINGLKLVIDSGEELTISEDEDTNLISGEYAGCVDQILEQLYGDSDITYEIGEEYTAEAFDVDTKKNDPTEAMYYLIESDEENKASSNVAPYWQIGMCRDNAGEFLSNMNLYLALKMHDDADAGMLPYEKDGGLHASDICNWIRTCTVTEMEK